MAFSNLTIPLRVYFDIDYRIACVIAVVVFGVYYTMLLRTELWSGNGKGNISVKKLR